MRTVLALALTMLALPAQAAGSKGDVPINSRDGAAPPAAIAAAGPSRTELFVESNITETLYHELAHALIDVMDLPVFGPEEFAADFFAIVLMNRMFDEDTLTRMTYDVAAAYDAGAVKEQRVGTSLDMWDVHGTDEQRYFNLACFMYGANPEVRYDIAVELGLPEARALTCEDEYAMAARAWNEVLDQLAAAGPGETLEMDWVINSERHLPRFVAAEVDRLNAAFSLPEPIAVSVIPCGEVNAFYDWDKREILICTEMGAYLAELAP